jgi:hypothetical protein
MTDETLLHLLTSHQLMGGAQTQMSATLSQLWDLLLLPSFNVFHYYGKLTIKFGATLYFLTFDNIIVFILDL